MHIKNSGFYEVLKKYMLFAYINSAQPKPRTKTYFQNSRLIGRAYSRKP